MPKVKILNKITGATVIIALTVLMAGGCGQKGSLYLPDKDAEKGKYTVAP